MLFEKVNARRNAFTIVVANLKTTLVLSFLTILRYFCKSVSLYSDRLF